MFFFFFQIALLGAGGRVTRVLHNEERVPYMEIPGFCPRHPNNEEAKKWGMAPSRQGHFSENGGVLLGLDSFTTHQALHTTPAVYYCIFVANTVPPHYYLK